MVPVAGGGTFIQMEDEIAILKIVKRKIFTIQNYFRKNSWMRKKRGVILWNAWRIINANPIGLLSLVNSKFRNRRS
jgi:hypothetical protein